MQSPHPPDVDLAKLQAENRERLKELRALNTISTMLARASRLEDSLQDICNILPPAWQYPEATVARITFRGQPYVSPNFRPSPYVQRQPFGSALHGEGTVEVYYTDQRPESYEGPFLREERNLIVNIASLLTGKAAQDAYEELMLQNRERVKELQGLNRVTDVLTKSTEVPQMIQDVVDILPAAWQYPADTCARITYGSIVKTSKGFQASAWVQREDFSVPHGHAGSIEVYYLGEHPELDEGPFLREERNLIHNIAGLLGGRLALELFENTVANNAERLKELAAINQTTAIIRQGGSVAEALQQIAEMLPASWQYPEQCAARITFAGNSYVSAEFAETRWFQRETFTTLDNRKGIVEVFYLREMPPSAEGPFLAEERNLIRNVAQLIAHYINNIERRDVLRDGRGLSDDRSRDAEEGESLITARTPLQRFFNRQILDKYVFLDMMKFKIREILFVATLYDAAMLEVEDSFFERFMGAMLPYSLYALPRITGVMSGDEALEALDHRSFDLVVLMTGVDKEETSGLSARIRQRHPELPVYLLANRQSHVQYFMNWIATTGMADKLFIWNGSSDVFFAIVKSIEDMANVGADTQLALVGVILVIEDSPEHYSRLLTMLYSILFDLIQRFCSESARDEMDRISKMRSRPKVIHVRNFEDAASVYNRYRHSMLAIISDAEFERTGEVEHETGCEFIKSVRKRDPGLPILMQSAREEYGERVCDMNVEFLNKSDRGFAARLRNFVESNLGLGPFVFCDSEGSALEEAESVDALQDALATVPASSIRYHVRHGHISRWLMLRGVVKAARMIGQIGVEEDPGDDELRRLVRGAVQEHLHEESRGKVLPYRRGRPFSEDTVTVVGGGSLGGKGRGVAFLNSLVHSADFASTVDDVVIRTPVTVVLGTNEFENFLERAELSPAEAVQITFAELRERFLATELSDTTLEALHAFVDQSANPVAVRSSSLFEDSASQPFSGVFHTYQLANNSPDRGKRIAQLADAVKLVYASLYTSEARSYFEAVGRRLEDERMAVILQELVGRTHGEYYYPHISGVARSLNFYPVAYMKPEEGYCSLAVGLGSYVVEGHRSHGFSPRYPDVQFGSIKERLENSQRTFYAVALSAGDADIREDGENACLEQLDLSRAEEHGTLGHCVSVYVADSDRLAPGLRMSGPRITDFADVLRYKYVLLAPTVDALLGTVREALGSPVEIEFAVNLPGEGEEYASLYLLQVKPLTGETAAEDVDLMVGDTDGTLVYSSTCLGNGRVSGIRDVVYVDPRKFDKLKTHDIASEVSYLNMKLIAEDTRYVLIGPGRWGTRDPSLGVPVVWSQIAGAAVIVEAGLAGFTVEASLGSHFFHNLTSRKVGYFSVEHGSLSDAIQWERLNEAPAIEETEYCRHVRFDTELRVFMDGRTRKGQVLLT